MKRLYKPKAMPLVNIDSAELTPEKIQHMINESRQTELQVDSKKISPHDFSRETRHPAKQAEKDRTTNEIIVSYRQARAADFTTAATKAKALPFSVFANPFVSSQTKISAAHTSHSEPLLQISHAVDTEPSRSESMLSSSQPCDSVKAC